MKTPTNAVNQNPETMGERKSKRPAVGGSSSKSANFLEAKQANKRKMQKIQAQQDAQNKEEEKQWMEEQDEKYQPVDKHDVRNLKKI